VRQQQGDERLLKVTGGDDADERVTVHHRYVPESRALEAGAPRAPGFAGWRRTFYAWYRQEECGSARAMWWLITGRLGRFWRRPCPATAAVDKESPRERGSPIYFPAPCGTRTASPARPQARCPGPAPAATVGSAPWHVSAVHGRPRPLVSGMPEASPPHWGTRALRSVLTTSRWRRLARGESAESRRSSHDPRSGYRLAASRHEADAMPSSSGVAM
jgi:hypothetical protein